MMAKKRVSASAAKKPAKSPKPMSPEHEKLITRFHALIQGFPGATQRITFGSPAYYINGQMFTARHGDSMILRLAPADLETFMKLDGAGPFEPMPGRPMKGWASVP